MRKILFASLVLATLGASTSAIAQAAGPAGGPPKGSTLGDPNAGIGRAMQRMQEEILAKLDLTPDQKAKIAAHQKETMLKRRELMKAGRGAAQTPEMREKAQELRKENQEFMAQTLTKEQLKQFRDLSRQAMQELRAKAGATPTKP